MNITFVDIEDANDEGLLFDDNDVDKVVDKMIKKRWMLCSFLTVILELSI